MTFGIDGAIDLQFYPDEGAGGEEERRRENGRQEGGGGRT